MDFWIVLASIAVIAGVYVLVPVGLAMRSRHRQPRMLPCPDARVQAAVQFSRTGWAEAFGRPSLRRVGSCSLRETQPQCREACRALPEDALNG
jgi:hypothetical protein